MNWFAPNRLSLERYAAASATRLHAASPSGAKRPRLHSRLSTPGRATRESVHDRSPQSQDAVGGGQPCEMRWKASRLLLAVGTCLVLGPRPTTAQSKPGTGSTKLMLCFAEQRILSVDVLHFLKCERRGVWRNSYFLIEICPN
jgi:hypothetical protein